MPLSDKDFIQLCDEFCSASDNLVDKILDEYGNNPPHEMNTPQIRRQTTVMAGTLGKVFMAFAKTGLMALAAKIPGKIGQHYDNILSGPDTVLAPIFTEMAAATLINDNVHPMRIRDKMPKGLFTQDALSKAEEHKMPNLATLIRSGLE